MAPLGDVEVGAELAIHPLEEIEVEARRYAFRVVIGLHYDINIFFKIETDEEVIARAHFLGNAAKEGDAVGKVKVSN